MNPLSKALADNLSLLNCKAPLHSTNPDEWGVHADYLEEHAHPEAALCRRVAIGLAKKPRLALTIKIFTGTINSGFSKYSVAAFLRYEHPYFRTQAAWMPLSSAIQLGIRTPTTPRKFGIASPRNRTKYDPELAWDYFKLVAALYGIP